MILRGYGSQRSSGKKYHKINLKDSDIYSLSATIMALTIAIFLVALQVLLPSF